MAFARFFRAAALAFPTAAASLISPRLCGPPTGLTNGTQESFKSFETNLERVAAVNNLEHTLDPDYFGSDLFNATDNKIMYFLLEKAVKGNVLAYSHFKKAPKQDGNKAYFALRDAFVFSAQATGALSLMKLTNFRLGQGELVSAFCLRLRELFEELEELEGDHAFVFNDTQRLGYLLTSIGAEVELEASDIVLFLFFFQRDI